MQQELFFCELSALILLDPPTRLDTSAQVSFGNLTLEYQSTSHSVSLDASDCFVTNLLQRHDLAQETCTTSLDTEELNDQSASQDVALEADQQELFRQTVGELTWLATACRPDLSFEAHLLAQSLEAPTTREQMQLRKVLRHLAETRHFSLSLHPATTKTTREKPQSLELVAYSSTSWSEAEAATSTTCLQLWGASLIAFHKPACAQEQHHAELESMRLALGLACLIRSLLQQLDMDQLEKEVHIHLRISSWNQELVPGRPIAEQLGISRRNKHIQLRGQVQLSKVHPSKNLAHNLSHNASDRTMHAKLRLNPEVAETGALSTVFGQEPAFPFSSSSLLVGMVAAKPSQMEKPQLRQLALADSEACLESLSKNLATTSLASLTLCSLSFESELESLNLESWSFPTHSLTLRSLIRPKDRLHSLTKQSLSLNNCSFHSLTRQSLSLIYENCFSNLSFRKVSLEDGNQELEENLAINLLNRRAETNSFSRISLQERKPYKEAKTNSFWTQSFRGILSLYWPIFLLCSFQWVCSALFSKTSFPTQSLQQNQLEEVNSNNFQIPSLQPEELAAAYFSSGFPEESFQKDELSILHQDELSRSILDSFDQLDTEMSLSFLAFNKIQLQENSFCTTSFGQEKLYSIYQLDLDDSLSYQQVSFQSCSSNSLEKKAFQCTALLFRIRSVQSFHLTGQQLTGTSFSFSFVSGGASQLALQTLHCTASTFISLSFAVAIACSNTAWQRKTFAALTLMSLTLAFVRAWCQIALRMSILSACTWISLSLAIKAWLNIAGFAACKSRSLTRIFLTTSCRRAASTTSFQRASSTTALKPTSFTRAASATASLPNRSKRSLRTTSFRTTSSSRASTRTTFRRTSSRRRTLHTMLLFSFLFNIFFSSSLRRKEIEKKDELSTTSLELELEKLVANQTCSLDLYHGHLEQIFWQNQLQQNSFEKNNNKIQKQLSEAVPDNQLSQLHLHQLRLQDPAFRNQFPEESWSTSFTKKELSAQDLSTISFDKFFPENFPEQLAENQLQQNLSTDQKQLQNNKLSQNNLSAAQLQPAQLPREDLEQRACNNLCQEELGRALCFSDLSLQQLGFPEPSFRTAWREQPSTRSSLNKAALPRQQKKKLAKNSFSAQTFQQTASTSSFLATAWFRAVRPKQLHDQNFFTESFKKQSLRTRPLTRSLWQQACQQELQQDSFRRTSLKKRTLQRPAWRPLASAALRHFAFTAFQQQLAKKNFDQTSFFNSSFPAGTSNRTAFQSAAFSNRASDQKPFSQQLAQQDLQTGSFTDSSLTGRTFSSNSLADTAFRTEASGRTPLQTATSRSTALTQTPLRRALQTALQNKQLCRPKNLQTRALQTRALKKKTLQTRALQRRTSQRRALTRASFAKSSFLESSFEASSFAACSLEEHSLANTSFADNELQGGNLQRRELPRSQLPREQLDSRDLRQEQLSKQELTEAQLGGEQLGREELPKKHLGFEQLHRQQLQAELCPEEPCRGEL